MEPPWAVTMSFAMASPSPAPGEPGPLTKRSKTRERTSSGMPSPVSRTAILTLSPERLALTMTLPPDGVTDGVGEKIGQDTADPHRVGIEGRRVRRDLGRQPHPAAVRQALKGGQTTGD